MPQYCSIHWMLDSREWDRLLDVWWRKNVFHVLLNPPLQALAHTGTVTNINIIVIILSVISPTHPSTPYIAL